MSKGSGDAFEGAQGQPGTSRRLRRSPLAATWSMVVCTVTFRKRTGQLNNIAVRDTLRVEVGTCRDNFGQAHSWRRYHVRYGEILFTLYGNERGGNAEQVRTARKYFAHALELKPSGNLRALYGLLLCCAAAGKGSKGRDVAELVAFAKQTLTEAYADAKSPMLTLVKSMIETLLT
eukprot:1413441-Pleurochrysis_carterae.AAC.1